MRASGDQHGARSAQVWPKAVGESIRRVTEHQVPRPRARRATQEGQSVGAEHPRRVCPSAARLRRTPAPRRHRSRQRSRSPRHGRAPRSPAPPSPRTGRAPAGRRRGPRMLNSASRTRSESGSCRPGRSQAPAAHMRLRRRASRSGGRGHGRDRVSTWSSDGADPKRARRERSSACSGRASSGSAASRAIGPGAGQLQQLGVLRQRGDAKPGSPCWRVPSTSPSPRSVRSISASRNPSRSAASASSRGGQRPSAPKSMHTARGRRGRPAPAADEAGRCRSGRPPRSPSPMRSARRCRPRSRSSRPARRPLRRRTRAITARFHGRASARA